MPDIFVNTDNSDLKNKIYNASKLGKSAAAAEKKIKEAVEAAIRKAPGFTTDKPSKGYTLRMTVATEHVGRATKYTVIPEIVRYPKAIAERGKGKGEDNVFFKATLGSATVDHTSEAEIVDLIGELAQSDVKASLQTMRMDMARR